MISTLKTTFISNDFASSIYEMLKKTLKLKAMNYDKLVWRCRQVNDVKLNKPPVSQMMTTVGSSYGCNSAMNEYPITNLYE